MTLVEAIRKHSMVCRPETEWRKGLFLTCGEGVNYPDELFIRFQPGKGMSSILVCQPLTLTDISSNDWESYIDI